MDHPARQARVPASVAMPLRKIVRGARLQRNRLVRQRRVRALRQALDTIRSKAPDLPSRDDLERLIWAWSNTAAGDVEYLLATIREARTAEGSILECGSGLTTMLLEIYASQPVITLENHEQWAAQVAAELTPGGRVELRHVPLREFVGFSWYDVATDSLPTSFALVVCDGPPLSGEPGGRVGLLPILGDRLPAGTVFLVDQHMQSAEKAAIDRWKRDYGLVEVPDETPILTLRRNSGPVVDTTPETRVAPR